MASVDFDHIRKTVSVVDVLPWLDIELKAKNGELRGPCPLHGGERPFVVNPGLNVWSCWVPSCRLEKATAGGGVIELAAKVKKLPFRAAAIEIQNQFLVARPAAPEGLHKVAAYLEPGHEAVKALGISEEDAVRLGIGYAPKGVFRGRVLLPIRTIEGKLIGYAGYTDQLQPALKIPSKLF